MPVPIYQIDAFTDTAFRGNPAGVCLLDAPADEIWMQHVATEMNLSETAFPVRRSDGDFDLRWFTPAVEVDLCGHATLATAHILWETGRLESTTQTRFHTASGILIARRAGDRIELDFPANPPKPSEPPDGLLGALGIAAAYVGRTSVDSFVEADDAEAVRSASPDFGRLRQLGVRGVILTAQSENESSDFISRFFAPGAGIDEDPVTGAAHCALAPYWADKLGRDRLVGYQASARGGTVHCRVVGDRVRLAGQAVTVLRGELVPIPSLPAHRSELAPRHTRPIEGRPSVAKSARILTALGSTKRGNGTPKKPSEELDGPAGGMTSIPLHRSGMFLRSDRPE